MSTAVCHAHRAERPRIRLTRVLFALIIAAAVPLSAVRAAPAEWMPTRAFRTFNKATWRGLPQSSVMALAQDSDGLLWIGTLDGVATFDGRSINAVAATPGAPARAVITGIIARKAGGVYVGSPAGVHLFDGRSWRLLPTRRAVSSLTQAADGTLWIADFDGTLWSYEGERWRRHDIGASAVSLSAARDGTVWVATPDSAVRVGGAVPDRVAGATLPSRPAAILAASDGHVWVATAGGTVHWTTGDDGWHQAPFERWPRNAFRCLAEDRRGRIWAGAYGGGAAFGTATTPWTVWHGVNGPFDAGVMSIMTDRDGSLWFGLNAVGLVQWLGEEWSHRTASNPMAAVPLVSSSFAVTRGFEPGSILVGTFNAGALRLDSHGFRQFDASNGLTEDTRALIEPSPGTYFAATRFGIFESHDAGAHFEQRLRLQSGFVTFFFRSPEGRWYAASTQGVYERTGEEWVPANAINAALDDLHVRDMKWLTSGELWIATLRGISIFSADGSARHLTSHTTPALPESVNAIIELPDHAIWAGGTGGIGVLHDGHWSKMTEANGLPGATIYTLAAGKHGEVWAGGSDGVGRFQHGVWKVWDSRSGLLQEECNLNGLVVDDDGSVYVGTMGGTAHFDPSVKPIPPAPLQLTWRGAPAADADGIARLRKGDRALRLRWSASSIAPQPVQFRIRIPRLHDSWSAPTPEDHIEVENLAAGRWNVEVEGRREGSSSWSHPIALTIEVPPFWYETLVARIGLAALLLAFGYALVRLRLRALRRHAATLEAIVRERTAQLAEKVEALHDSEQRALAASHAKSAFLANMSHELRTPLNGVLGFAQLLARRKNRDPEDREGLTVIMKSGEHLLGLINDVLSLSKIEAGRVALDDLPFSLANVVRDVHDVLRFSAEEKQLELTCEIEPDAMRRIVRGDERRLRQILMNLLGNAIKFTEAGHVALRTAWRDGRAFFEIEDTGPGIAPAELATLFEPFVQSESGRRSSEGTGLGLALSRNLARLMDGDITVTSEVGRGSCFNVTVALPEASEDQLESRTPRRVAALAPGQEGIRILVVDDVAVNRTVLSRLLQGAGFEVREAADGTSALALWETWHPHLIWMDKWMEGLDGLAVTRRIRTSEQAGGGARVPILALSASALEQERGEILEAGCDDFVAKPFRDSTIFDKIQQFLGVRYLYEDDVQTSPPPSETEETQETRGSVLLVDDDWVCREVAGELLRDSGVAVTSVSSGREALGLLQRQHFDLVLMDLNMPDIDGREATRRIRATPGLEMLPIIAMSASTPEDERGGAKAAEVDGYIGKPVDPAALTAMVRRWIPASH